MNNQAQDHPIAKPQKIPSPTYWPVVLALGITFIFWGFVTSFIISCAGLIIFGTALTGWIRELRRDHQKSTQSATHHEA